MSKKVLKTTIVIILFTILVTGIWLFVSNDTQIVQEATTDTSAESTIPRPSTEKENLEEQQEEAAEENQSKNIENTPPTDINLVLGGDLKIDSLDQENGIIFVSASITSDSPGECIYNFTAAETRPISRSNSAFIQGDQYVCYEDVNEAEFTKLGDWTAEVVFTSEGDSYQVTEKFNVQ